VSIGPRGRYAFSAERRLHLRDLVQILVAHWRVAAAVTFLVLGATYAASRRAQARYQSSATIQVNSKKQVFARLDDIDVEEMALRTDPVLSEALVLTTQGLALAVADNLGLRLQVMDPGARRGDYIYDVQVDSTAVPDSFQLRLRGPEGYQLRDGRGALIASGPYFAPVTGPGFTLSVRPPPGDDEVEVRLGIVPLSAAADLVRGGVAFAVQPSTNVVTVTHTGGDPTLVPDILNAALHALQNYGADKIREIAAQRLTYIQERVGDAQQRYLASLARIQSYQEQQATTDLSAEEIALINTIQEFEREKERRRLDLATIEGILGQSQDSVTFETVNRLAAVAAISSNPAMGYQLESLLRLYDERRTLVTGTMGLRENNPQVQALDSRIQASSRALVDATRATIRGLETAISQIEENIQRQRDRLGTFPGKQSQFAQLELEAQLQNDTYRYLLSQFEAARISAATIAPYVQIIETATVAQRVGIGLRQKLIIGLMIGLFLGVLAAFFLEYLDQTIKTASDVERVIEVPVLGLIPYEPRPALPGGNGRRRTGLPLVSLLSPDHPSSEAYRALRTNVTFVNAEQRGLQLLVITSPGPGEGKSTTAANLAITLAQQGTATLLVDADLRRPLVHRAFNLVQEPGLTDVLIGAAQVREAIRPNVVPKLDVLPAGALPPNPSELLGSEAMRRLLEQLRGHYETVIFDSPPALAVTDASVLGANTDAVILVLRAGETEEVAAQRAIEQLRRVQARVAGAVLNGVAKDRDRYYNYYTYSRADRPGPRGALAALRERIANLL
jgi:tyrosine-protein kinase Etk/Wzc